MRYALLVCLILVVTQSDAQLLRLPNYGKAMLRKDAVKIEIANDVPGDLKGDIQLTYKNQSGVFDGGSTIATFLRDDGSKLELLFANPIYWTDEAKQKSLAPVAIMRDNRPGRRSSLTEIGHQSACEARICDLLAKSLAAGKYSPDAALEVIALRDCLLTRKPLASMSIRVDPVHQNKQP